MIALDQNAYLNPAQTIVSNMSKSIQTTAVFIAISISMLIARCTGSKSGQEIPAVDTTAANLPDHSEQQRTIQDKIYGAWLDTAALSQNSTDAIYIARMSDVSEDQFEYLSRTGIHVSGYRFGKFNGTTKSILYGEYASLYGLVPSVIKYVSGGAEVKMDDFTAFEKLSGIKPFNSPPDGPAPAFKQVNPEFIDWAVVNLIPKPDASLIILTIWSANFRIFRLMQLKI
jgi:hypothetical protein